MKGKHTFIILSFLAIDLILIFRILIGDSPIPILNPQGWIGIQQRNIMVFAFLLMLLVVIPVFILTIFIALKYRDDNTKATYTPDWSHNNALQLSLWAFPTAIVLVLCALTWISAHKLEPRTSIAAAAKPMTIQVVALQWKWLFIYPEQGIATVNFVAFPEKTPIHFELTADNAPMNSFWIPSLGGQLYAMSGMIGRLHLIADKPGEFRGSNAEISGRGFAGMRFPVKSLTQDEFNAWVVQVQQSPNILTLDEYTTLSQPSENHPQAFYSSTADNLFTTIVMKYMAPMGNDGHSQAEIMPEMGEMHQSSSF